MFRRIRHGRSKFRAQVELLVADLYLSSTAKADCDRMTSNCCHVKKTALNLLQLHPRVRSSAERLRCRNRRSFKFITHCCKPLQLPSHFFLQMAEAGTFRDLQFYFCTYMARIKRAISNQVSRPRCHVSFRPFQNGDCLDWGRFSGDLSVRKASSGHLSPTFETRLPSTECYQCCPMCLSCAISVLRSSHLCRR